MYATEVEESHIERHGGLEMFKALAESQAKARKAAQVSPNAQIGPLHMTCGNVPGIGVPCYGDGYRRRDLGRFVPVWPLAVTASIQLQQLREIHVHTEILFNSGNVSAQPIRGDLEAPCNTLAQITNEVIGADRIPLCRQVGKNHLGFAINRHPDVGIAPLARIVRSEVFFLCMHECPKFIGLDESRTNITHSLVGEALALLSDCQKQRKNRALVCAGDTRDGTDGHTFHEQSDYLRCFFGLNVVASQWLLAGFGESSLAGLAAESLNPQPSVSSKSLSCSVLASDAGHRTSSLVFSREKSDNQSLGSECRVLPRLDSSPPLAETSGGEFFIYLFMLQSVNHFPIFADFFNFLSRAKTRQYCVHVYNEGSLALRRYAIFKKPVPDFGPGEALRTLTQDDEDCFCKAYIFAGCLGLNPIFRQLAKTVPDLCPSVDLFLDQSFLPFKFKKLAIGFSELIVCGHERSVL